MIRRRLLVGQNPVHRGEQLHSERRLESLDQRGDAIESLTRRLRIREERLRALDRAGKKLELLVRCVATIGASASSAGPAPMTSGRRVVRLAVTDHPAAPAHDPLIVLASRGVWIEQEAFSHLTLLRSMGHPDPASRSV